MSKRKTIVMKEKLAERLENHAERQGLSEAEIVRTSLTQRLGGEK